MKNSKEKTKEKLKPIERLKHSLTHGNIWLSILSLLKRKKDIYAYTLDRQMEENFGFKPNRIMIYVVLYKLEGEKLIASKFQERRKYYVLTTKGKQALDLAKEYLLELSKEL